MANREVPVPVRRKVVKAARVLVAPKVVAPVVGKDGRAVPARVVPVKAAVDLEAKAVPAGKVADNAPSARSSRLST